MMIFLDPIFSLTLPAVVGGLIGGILVITEPEKAQSKRIKEQALLLCATAGIPRRW